MNKALAVSGPRLSAVFLLAFASFSAPTSRAQDLRPCDPPALAVWAQPGHGSPLQRLAIAPPETVFRSLKTRAPADFQPYFDRQNFWPLGSPKQPSPILNLNPSKDERGTPILGVLYRAIDRDSLRVASGDGARVFEIGRDYRLDELSGCIAGVEGRLGAPGEAEVQVDYRIATQRLDLVQRDGAGRLSVKQGESALTCPALPDPDPGTTAVAGIYVAPWRRNGAYVVTAEDILPIAPADPVAPIRPEALARARAKLERGAELRIAFLGDSITLGAEAGAWWDRLWTPDNLGYPSRLVVALRKRYPAANITPIAAFQGGVTTQRAAALFDERVRPAGADVIIVAFGVNDADGPVGGAPRNPPDAYREQIRAVLRRAREIGAEALLVTPLQPSPMLRNGMAERVPAYRAALLGLAREENAAVADVYTEWLHLARRGIPPFSQLHNGYNHPGAAGHALYAEVLLRAF